MRQRLTASMMLLVTGQAVSLLLGFAFWLVAARRFDLDTVGLAALTITLATAVASLANLAAGSVIERFVSVAGPQAPRLLATLHLASAVSSAAAAALVGTIAHLAGTGVQIPVLVVLTVLTAATTLQDSELVGLDRAGWVPVRSVAQGLAKLVVLLALPTTASGTLIALAWTAATAVVVAVTAPVVHRWATRIGQTPSTARPTRPELRRYWRDSCGWLVAAGIPGLVLPLVVAGSLGTAEMAYFTTAWLLVTASDVLMMTSTSPFVARAAGADPAQMGSLVRTYAAVTVALSLARGLGLATVGLAVMATYGPGYLPATAALLMLMGLTQAVAAPATIYGGLARVEQRLGYPLAVQALGSALVIIGSAITVPRFGLVGVAYAHLATELVIVALAARPLRRTWRAAQRGELVTPRALAPSGLTDQPPAPRSAPNPSPPTSALDSPLH